jgi:hypothetical protein
MSIARTSSSSEVALFRNRGTGLRLELRVREGAANDEDPFVVLGDGGRLARVLLARVAIGEDDTVREFAIKLRRDAVIAPTSGFGNALLTNVEIDAMWSREREVLAALSSSSIVDRFDLVGQEESPPITYCKNTKEFFHPLSPRGNPLTVCRDDQLLRECGLPPYTAGTLRYLFAPVEVADRAVENKLVFYAVGPSDQEYPHPDVEVRRGTEVYRDFGRLVHEDHEESARRELAENLPCMECTSRDECYPRGSGPSTAVPAEGWLIPVTYYDSPMFALELCHLRYDELVDVLGGADWCDVEARVHGAGTGGRRQISSAISTALATGRQYFSADDDAGRPTEILGLKLGAFRQLCEGLRDLHSQGGAPCFDVSPENVMAKFVGSGGRGPARWQFHTRLIDVGAAQPYRPPATGTKAIPGVWIPVADVNRDFLSPLVEKSSIGRDHMLRFTVTDYVLDGEQYRIQVEGRTSGSLLKGIEKNDLLYLQPSSPVRQFADFELVASVTESDYRVIKAELILPNTALPESWSIPFAFDGIAVAHPKLGPACDLHGLGMLLFRSLFVNDGRHFGDMLVTVRRVIEKLELELSSGAEPGLAYAAVTLRRLLREEGGAFGCEEILHRAADRESASGAIPSGLWHEIVVFGFRLLSNADGFAFASHHGDNGSDWAIAQGGDAALMSRVIAEVDRFIAGVDVEQFGSRARDHEVVSLCETVLLEISEGMVRESSGSIVESKTESEIVESLDDEPSEPGSEARGAQ